MKYDLKTTSILISLFFTAQIFGLFIINQNFQVFGVESFVNQAEVSDAVFNLPLSILFVTLLFLIIYRLKFKRLLVFWYGLAFITTITISLSSFINELYALFVAFGLLLLRLSSKDDYFHNMSELLVYGGIAVIMLPLMSVNTIIILLLIISVYDFIAVRLSKHMISLAKTQFKLNIFSGLKIESEGSSAILGGGDIAFPLLTAGVMLRDAGLLPAILVIYGSMIGLMVLVLTGEENKFYPAMPFISSGCILGIIIGSVFL